MHAIVRTLKVFCLKQKSMRKSTRNPRVLTSRTYMKYRSLGKNISCPATQGQHENPHEFERYTM